MKRVEERWDLATVSMHNPRNKAFHFQRESKITNLILVRNRNETD